MKLQSYLKQIDTKEIATCILLIVVGYMTTQLFMRKYSGFRVGGQNSCYFGSDVTCKLGTFPGNSGPNAANPDPCSKVNKDDCNKSWWQSQSDGGGNGKTPIGKACKYEKDKCFTPGTPFHNISGCPAKSCSDSSNSPTVSCSSTGTWTYYADKCLINGSTVQNQSYNTDCEGLTNCKLTTWDKPLMPLTIIISILVIIVFGLYIKFG